MGRSSADKLYRAREEDSGLNYPIVVLVNRGTASAAEIVAGAIQDHDRGLIAGENTFGKGLVQTVYPLSENTGLALTTAKYYTPSGRLIQRDYNGVSLYDYYYSAQNEKGNNNNGNGNREIKMTDSGRPVYGGGGITPDVKLPALRSNRFQDLLMQRYAFFNFAKHYLISRHVPRDFEVDDAVLQDFRRFLDEQKIPYTEGELIEADAWLRPNIKAELFIAEFGHQEGLRVRAETDPQVVKALELLPMAKELAENARKVIAERGQGRALPQ
jgi:carboxyl-terminal processing protease